MHKRKVAQYLEKYIRGFSADQISSRLLSGEVELKNIELNVEPLKALLAGCLPYTLDVQEISCDWVHAHIPWTNLRKRPICVRAGTCHVRVEVHQANDLEWMVAAAKLQCDKLVEESAAAEVDGSAGIKPGSLGAVVVDGLQIQIAAVKITLLSTQPTHMPGQCAMMEGQVLPAFPEPLPVWEITIHDVVLLPCNKKGVPVDCPEDALERDYSTATLRRCLTLGKIQVGLPGGQESDCAAWLKGAPVVASTGGGLEVQIAERRDGLPGKEGSKLKRAFISSFGREIHMEVKLPGIQVQTCECHIAALISVLGDAGQPSYIPLEALPPHAVSVHWSQEAAEASLLEAILKKRRVSMAVNKSKKKSFDKFSPHKRRTNSSEGFDEDFEQVDPSPPRRAAGGMSIAQQSQGVERQSAKKTLEVAAQRTKAEAQEKAQKTAAAARSAADSAKRSAQKSKEEAAAVARVAADSAKRSSQQARNLLQQKAQQAREKSLKLGGLFRKRKDGGKQEVLNDIPEDGEGEGVMHDSPEPSECIGNGVGRMEEPRHSTESFEESDDVADDVDDVSSLNSSHASKATEATADTQGRSSIESTPSMDSSEGSNSLSETSEQLRNLQSTHGSDTSDTETSSIASDDDARSEVTKDDNDDLQSEISMSELSMMSEALSIANLGAAFERPPRVCRISLHLRLGSLKVCVRTPSAGPRTEIVLDAETFDVSTEGITELSTSQVHDLSRIGLCDPLPPQQKPIVSGPTKALGSFLCATLAGTSVGYLPDEKGRQDLFWTAEAGPRFLTLKLRVGPTGDPEQVEGCIHGAHLSTKPDGLGALAKVGHRLAQAVEQVVAKQVGSENGTPHAMSAPQPHVGFSCYDCEVEIPASEMQPRLSLIVPSVSLLLPGLQGCQEVLPNVPVSHSAIISSKVGPDRRLYSCICGRGSSSSPPLVPEDSLMERQWRMGLIAPAEVFLPGDELMLLQKSKCDAAEQSAMREAAAEELREVQQQVLQLETERREVFVRDLLAESSSDGVSKTLGPQLAALTVEAQDLEERRRADDAQIRAEEKTAAEGLASAQAKALAREADLCRQLDEEIIITAALEAEVARQRAEIERLIQESLDVGQDAN